MAWFLERRYQARHNEAGGPRDVWLRIGEPYRTKDAAMGGALWMEVAIELEGLWPSARRLTSAGSDAIDALLLAFRNARFLLELGARQLKCAISWPEGPGGTELGLPADVSTHPPESPRPPKKREKAPASVRAATPSGRKKRRR